jgi:hypothetical protein
MHKPDVRTVEDVVNAVIVDNPAYERSMKELLIDGLSFPVTHEGIPVCIAGVIRERTRLLINRVPKGHAKEQLLYIPGDQRSKVFRELGLTREMLEVLFLEEVQRRLS